MLFSFIISAAIIVALAFASIYGKSMVDIVLARHQFQVGKAIISAVKIFMVNLKPPVNGAIECLPYGAMGRLPLIFSVLAKKEVQIKVGADNGKHGAKSGITFPRFSVSYGCDSDVANSMRPPCLDKSAASKEHFSYAVNECWCEFLAALYTPAISHVGKLIERLKAKNWFPCLHRYMLQGIM